MNDADPGRPLRVAHLKPDGVEVARPMSVRDDVHRLVAALEADGIIVTEQIAYAAGRRHSDCHEAG